MRSEMGRKNASKVLIGRRIKREGESFKIAKNYFKSVDLDKSIMFLLCSMIYESEGGKSNFGVLEFTNSDPDLVKIFLSFLRKSFTLDENKFRVVMHLHSYHNEVKEKNFGQKLQISHRVNF